MTLIENGPWTKEVNESMGVIMNYFIKKHGIKNQLMTLNEHGSMSEVRYKTKWTPRQQDICQTQRSRYDHA